MPRVVEAAGWTVGLFGAGLAVIAVGRATAPAATDGDVADSDFFWPLTLALALLTMAGGFRIPRLWSAFGLVAIAPYFAYLLGIGYSLTPEQEAFRMLAFVLLLPTAVAPVLGALIGSRIRQRWDRKAVTSEPVA